MLQILEAEQLDWDSSIQVPNGLDLLNSAQDHFCRAAFTHPPDSEIVIQMVQPAACVLVCVICSSINLACGILSEDHGFLSSLVVVLCPVFENKGRCSSGCSFNFKFLKVEMRIIFCNDGVCGEPI